MLAIVLVLATDVASSLAKLPLFAERLSVPNSRPSMSSVAGVTAVSCGGRRG